MFEQNKNIIPLGSTQDPLASTEPEPDGSEGAGPFVSHTWSGDSEACRARGDGPRKSGDTMGKAMKYHCFYWE